MQIDWLNSDESTSSPEDSPARTSAQQASERASRALDPGCGPRCSELSVQSNRLGSSLRMFLGLELSARTGCSLTWQRQATPHGRSWWVLSMPAHRTEGSECGLLGTPTAAMKRRSEKFLEGRTQDLQDFVMRLLPTPTAVIYGTNCGGQNPEGPERPGLETMARRGMLPTPDASMGTGGRISSTPPTVTKRPSGAKKSLTINDAVHWMLPTPVVPAGGGTSRSGDRIGETPSLEGMARKGLLPTPQSYSQGESKSMPGLTPLDIAVRPELAKHAERAKERRKGLLPTPPQRDWKSGAASDETLNRNARDKAGVVGVHWHDSRHTAITRLAQRLHVLDLARMVGHRDLRQLQTYYNPPAEELAEKLG